MSWRISTIIVGLAIAALASGCSGAPGAKALEDSQAREHKQLKDAGMAVEEEPSDKAEQPQSKDDAKEPAGGQAAMLSDADMDKAKDLFTGSCGGCHTLTAAGTEGGVGPKLDATKMTAEQIYNQILNGKGIMPAGALKGDDAQLVADYVAQSAAG